MKLKVIRYSPDVDSTGGILFALEKFFGYVCEDEKREVKIPGETCIPPGTYEIKLRDTGGMNKRYHKKYKFHRGMLHLQDVPNFKWVYIHPGNTDDHTAGCLLVGFVASRRKDDNMVFRSVEAYKVLYKMIISHIDSGEKITIEIKELGDNV